MRGDVLLIVWGFGVPFEGFHQALRDSGGGMDVLQLREKTSFPDPITFFEFFIGKVVSFRTEVGLHFLFILINVFYESWEWACLTGINLKGIILLGSVLFLKLSLKAGAAPR